MTEAIYLEVSEKTEAAKKAGHRVSVSGMLKFWIIKLVEGLPNLLRGFREGFTIKTSIVVEGSS